MAYQAPVDDIMHALKTAAGLDGLIERGILGVDEDTIRAVIEEAGKFGAEVLDPLSAVGRPHRLEAGRRQGRHPARLEGGLPAVLRWRLGRPAGA